MKIPSDDRFKFISLLLLAVLLLSAISSYMIADHQDVWWWAWLEHLSFQLVTVALVAMLLKLMPYQRKPLIPEIPAINPNDEKSFTAEKQLKNKQNYAVSMLVQSTEPEVRQLILDEMRTLGLLDRANLVGIDLVGVNLSGSSLRSSNLHRARMKSTNLRSANLWGANLEYAILFESILEDARLWDASLAHCDLTQANLKGADLWDANLEGAFMQGADLSNARLQGTRFDRNTTLPDGSKWTPSTDMGRFTHPR
ncbi:MAG TPA: pentapeptide repeat-containing protein [Aggregatilineales bacterium]|nr:pentapeptide repeat-containing protein [Aggregatilineales bacterium]